MASMRRILVVLASIILLGYVLISREKWFSDLERHVTISRNPYYSQEIDLRRTNVFAWEINRNVWGYVEGPANILLAFEQTENMRGKDYWNKDFDLKVKIDAYAITENNIKAQRLIQNYFFPTDEPMSKETKIWAGWGDRDMEYLVGQVMRFPKEDLYIKLTILSPDPVLANANPRLKIVGDYDSAVIGHLMMLKLGRDIGILVCLLSLGVPAVQAWRS